MPRKPSRLRRNRVIRQLVKETRLCMSQIIYPVFLVEGSAIKEEIPSMKDQYHFSVDMLVKELPMLKSKGIDSLLLFASTHQKSGDGSSGAAPDGLIQRALRALKASATEMFLIADVCLCQYKEDGHCCIYTDCREIDRLATLKVLSEIALSYAEAGADMVAPSDAMDNRVAMIRNTLDQHGYEHIAIMAYSVKYASAFYGPFRDAAHSAPSFGDRKAYQMDPANRREALKEALMDVDEGADIVMVKPAMAYLDVISDITQVVDLPVAAYQVSGEYAMLYSAVASGQVDQRVIYESLLAIRRSGATMIISYFAKEIQRLLNEEAAL